MEKILIIVDMQKDFVDGSLGTKEAQAIVPAVKEKIENFNGDIIFTKDTHCLLYTSSKNQSTPSSLYFSLNSSTLSNFVPHKVARQSRHPPKSRPFTAISSHSFIIL